MKGGFNLVGSDDRRSDDISTRYYYQYQLGRLGACRLTIHALLHVPDDVLISLPIWAGWTFVMERYAGSLLPAVKSRKNANAVLAQRVKRVAQLEHIKNKYGPHALLRFGARQSEISTKEIVYPECTCHSHLCLT